MPSVRNRHDAMARIAERAVVLALIVCGAVLIIVPMLLTIYLAVRREADPVSAARLHARPGTRQSLPNFARAIVTSLELGAAAVVGSLLLGIPAGIGLSRHRFRGRGAVSTLLLAPLTVPAIALGLAIYVLLVGSTSNSAR